MSAIQNFAFEEHLVRVVEQDGEPWFVGKDVCGVLGIKDHTQALETLDEDERGGSTVPTPQGEQTMIVVSEPGVYRLVFRSRKPEAERFKRWLAHEVLPQIRRTGRFDPSNSAGSTHPLPTEQRSMLSLVTEARMTYGPARARLLWESLPGLPQVPQLPTIAAEDEREGFACLGHMLSRMPNGEFTIREYIEEAFEETEEALRMLRDLGIRVVTDPNLGAGIAVATAPELVRQLLVGSRWAGGIHQAALKVLPRAVGYKNMKFSRTSKTIFIPARLLLQGSASGVA